MKNFTLIVLSTWIMFSCAVKIPYTTQLENQFDLKNEEKISKVQFFTSTTIILDEELKVDASNTTQNGTLVSSSSSSKESIIIPAGTKCIFDSYGSGSNKKLFLRFETGDGKVIPFQVKNGGSSMAKRFYFSPNYNGNKPTLKYGNKDYKVRMNTTSDPRSAYLQVVKKRLNKTKRKERVVKGMKV